MRLPPYDEWRAGRPPGVREWAYYAWLQMIEADWGLAARCEAERQWHRRLSHARKAQGDLGGWWFWHGWHEKWAAKEQRRIDAASIGGIGGFNRATWFESAEQEQEQERQQERKRRVYWASPEGQAELEERRQREEARLAEEEAARVARRAEIVRRRNAGRHDRLSPDAEILLRARYDRNRWIYLQCLRGRTLRAIGAEFGLQPERVRQIEMKEARLENGRRKRLVNRGWLRPNVEPKGRVLDPDEAGAPRGVWLEFYPPPDPRLANMAPVRPQ